MNAIDQILGEIESLDLDFRENGISDEYRRKWNVVTNVGPWIIGKDTVACLREIIQKHQPQHIVEVGTSVGYSALIMADEALKYGGKVSSIELEDYKFKEASENLKRSGLENIQLIHGDASQVLHDWNEPIDLLFLDGNKRGYLTQFKNAEPHFSDDIVIIADNVTDMKKQVQDFLDYIQSNKDYKTKILDIDHGVLVAKKSR